jgi:predicted kinase
MGRRDARFDEAQTLDHVAERGGLRDGLPEKLARMVAAMHRRAEPVDSASWLAALVKYIDQNTDGFRQHKTIFPNAQLEELDRRSRAALERLRPLLIERGKLGLIRHCHGDLHLGNIALVENEPVAFDAIEFDPVIASGDVLYDLAFLLMDLVERDLGGAANTVLNDYFEASRRIEDCDGLAALPLFLSLRASIRAMVTAARLERATEDKRDAIAQAAAKYFRLALDLLTTPAPKVTATGGLSGTGKSVLARGLAPFIAPVPGALVLRSDVERKTLFGKGETERLPPEAYQAEVSERVYAVLYDKAARIARAGHSVIADAVFAKEHEREAIEAVARDAGVGFQGFHLTADLDTRIKRIGGRGPDASDANASVARQQEEFALGKVNWISVDASGTPAETLTRARNQMS